MTGWDTGVAFQPHNVPVFRSMFEKKSDIQPYFAATEAAPFAAAIERLCVPAIAFLPANGAADAIARLGGLPRLPAALAWPERPAYPNGKALAERMAGRSDKISGGLVQPLPLHFMAEIDLAAVRRFGMMDTLPPDGRLLFFWDALCGPWVDEAEGCRVIHDRSPAAALAPREPPQALHDALEGESMTALFPEQWVAPLGIWSAPDRFLMEALADGDLRASFEDEDWEEAWDEVSETMIDLGPHQLTSGREVLPHRLGGWPIPEQGDPRYTAVAASHGVLDMLGRTPNEAEQAACEAEMHDWVLLLQTDANKLTNVYAGGTVYFVMRKSDLQAANFERVHAIYQQT